MAKWVFVFICSKMPVYTKDGFFFQWLHRVYFLYLAASKFSVMKKSESLFPLLLVFVLVGLSSCGSGKEKKSNSSNSSEPAPLSNTSRAVDSIPVVSNMDLLSKLSDAALEGDIEGVNQAIESGVNVNGMDEGGRTALMFASFNGHSEIVLNLLEAGAAIDMRDAMGRTSLLYAATGPFPETVKILLDKGAEPNVIDSDEHFTPLMHAAAEGNLDVVKVLLKAGSDPTLIDVDGDNAASFARQAGHIEVADYLQSL